MKKVLPVVFTMLLLAAMCYTHTGHLSDAFAEDFFTISIALSPETIVLSNKATGFCGIHTNIGYGAVDTSTLVLSNSDEEDPKEIPLARPNAITKSDSHGNLIVMVRLEKLKEIVSVPSTTLMLSGATKGGDAFVGSDIVRVKD